MKITVWEVDLEGHVGHPGRDIKEPAGYVSVEFRSRISGGSARIDT